jgi:hypothetical protein
VGLDGEVLPPPPQPDANRDRNASNSAQQDQRNCLSKRQILFEVKTRPMPPAMASPLAGSHGGRDGLERRSGFSMAVGAAVVTVIVVEAGDPPDGVTFAGEKEQAA